MAGAWSVANGEALFVSFYDPKAVVTLELTILCGWWAELGLPSMAIMTDNDLRGLAGSTALAGDIAFVSWTSP